MKSLVVVSKENSFQEENGSEHLTKEDILFLDVELKGWNIKEERTRKWCKIR